MGGKCWTDQQVIEKLQADVAAQDAELAAANEQIEQLRQENAGLRQQLTRDSRRVDELMELALRRGRSRR